jgi:hypothetical protein
MSTPPNKSPDVAGLGNKGTVPPTKITWASPFHSWWKNSTERGIEGNLKYGHGQRDGKPKWLKWGKNKRDKEQKEEKIEPQNRIGHEEEGKRFAFD